MSSHVVVLDSSARRAVIKTNPSKYLTDVLQEACVKLALDPTRHGLKYELRLPASGLVPISANNSN